MQYLNNEIEALTKRKNKSGLAKQQLSCGIFQDIEATSKKEESATSKED